jgi:hypothetical protein
MMSRDWRVGSIFRHRNKRFRDFAAGHVPMFRRSAGALGHVQRRAEGRAVPIDHRPNS